jgi:hypothetical protein
MKKECESGFISYSLSCLSTLFHPYAMPMYLKHDSKRQRKARNNPCPKSGARGIIIITALLALVLLYWRLFSTTIRIHQKDQHLLKKHLPNTINRHEFFLFNHEQPASSHNHHHTDAAKLEFIHITKTGGTAVERAAARAGIAWGVCHYQAQRDTCHNIRPNLGWPQTFPLETDHIPYANNFFAHAEKWHTPPHWFVNNPFKGMDTFTIVRNPYDRYISEFYCPHFGYYSSRKALSASSNQTTNLRLLLSNSVANMSDWNAASDRVARFQQLAKERIEFDKKRHDSVQTNREVLHRRRLLQQPDKNKNHNNNGTLDNERSKLNKWLLHRIRNYQGLTGHLLPQYHYVYDTRGNQVVTHVLKYESLQKDFDLLMKRYHLPITLPAHLIHGGSTNGQERLSRTDLSKQVIQAINHFCRLDFERFGYDMIMADP